MLPRVDTSFCKDEERGLILCGMWSLWSSQNDRKHGKTPIDPGAAINWALEVCCHLISACPSVTEAGTDQLLKWMKPAEGTLKLNTDGAFLHNEGIGATGVVVRDSDGRLRAATAWWHGLMGSALQAEAEAIRDGVSLIPTESMEHIIAETDSQELVSIWMNRGNKDQKSLQSWTTLRSQPRPLPPSELFIPEDRQIIRLIFVLRKL